MLDKTPSSVKQFASLLPKNPFEPYISLRSKCQNFDMVFNVQKLKNFEFFWWNRVLEGDILKGVGRASCIYGAKATFRIQD